MRAPVACGGAHFLRRTCSIHCRIQRRVQAEVAASVHAYLNKVSDRLTVNAATLQAFGITKGHRGSCSVCVCSPESLTTPRRPPHPPSPPHTLPSLTTWTRDEMNKFAQLTAACERSRWSSTQAKRLKANRGVLSRAAVSTVPGSKVRVPFLWWVLGKPSFFVFFLRQSFLLKYLCFEVLVLTSVFTGHNGFHLNVRKQWFLFSLYH